MHCWRWISRLDRWSRDFFCHSFLDHSSGGPFVPMLCAWWIHSTCTDVSLVVLELCSCNNATCQTSSTERNNTTFHSQSEPVRPLLSCEFWKFKKTLSFISKKKSHTHEFVRSLSGNKDMVEGRNHHIQRFVLSVFWIHWSSNRWTETPTSNRQTLRQMSHEIQSAPTRAFPKDVKTLADLPFSPTLSGPQDPSFFDTFLDEFPFSSCPIWNQFHPWRRLWVLCTSISIHSTYPISNVGMTIENLGGIWSIHDWANPSDQSNKQINCKVLLHMRDFQTWLIIQIWLPVGRLPVIVGDKPRSKERTNRSIDSWIFSFGHR